MKVEYRDVVPLVQNIKGWTSKDVIINQIPRPSFTPEILTALDAAAQRTQELRSPFGDTNDPKASVRRLLIQGNELLVDFSQTEYFELWGLPGAASELHRQALNELNQNKATDIPMGVSTHNIVLISPKGKLPTDETSVVMIINERNHGFAPGRLSISYEGQTDPTRDTDPNGVPSTHITVLRTLEEELGIGLDQSNIETSLGAIRLIAICAEKGSAYTSWCHVVWVQATLADLVTSYKVAPRHRDTAALLAVPLNKIAAFTQDKISIKDYEPYIIANSLTKKPDFVSPHPTVPWRIGALMNHLSHQYPLS